MTGKTGADAPSWRQPRQAVAATAVPAAIPTAVNADAAAAASYSAASPDAASSLPPVGSPTSGGWPAWKEQARKKDSDNWRAHPPPAVVLQQQQQQQQQQHQSHQAAAPSLIVGSPPKTPRSPRSAMDAAAGPATPLNPLVIAGTARPLAHPNLSPRLGGENWALTPSSSLPSLPGTPRRPPRSMGSQGSEDVATTAAAGGLTMGSPAFRAMAAAAASTAQMSSGSSSRDLVAARALLNRRTDEAGGTAVRAGPAATPAPPQPQPAPVATQRNLAVNVMGSPKRSPLSLAPTSTAMLPPSVAPGNRAGRATPNLSPGPSPRLAHRSVSPIDTSSSVTSILAPSAVVPGAATPAQSLLRRDSMASITSSSTPAGAHTLSHSRKASQIFSPSSTASPSSSSVMSGTPAGFRPYRPPHLRNRDSGHNLRPAVQHYDRVRTPSLRGQSRSPDPNSAAASSRAGSRPPSTTPFSPSTEAPDNILGRAPGRRRLSSLGSFQSVVVPEDLSPPPTVDEREERQGEATSAETLQPRTPEANGNNMDSRTLMDKLVLTWSARRSAQAAPPSSAAAASSYGGDEESVEDDVDLSIDEMLAASGTQLSLTDSFCLSRHASHLTNDARPVDIFEVGDRLGPGMMHDGLRIGIAETSQGFEQQVADITGSQLEVVRKLGEGSYAVVYLVREVDPDDAPLNDDGAFGAPDGLIVSATPKPGQAEDDLYSRTLRASDLAGKVVPGDAGEAAAARHQPREFALKCLCKRDLSDEMLEVQRLESTIHQSIPRHPHIVTLYRTYETADWLFLILEYCPGQDLYYWLEQAQDADVPVITNGHARFGSDSDATDGSLTYEDGSVTLGGYASGDTTVLDATPPSPSLLASTAGAALLSRKRLRLVSRMFRQMCEAVQFCHDRGISHRDIKPENFIVEDRRSQEDATEEVEMSRAASSRPSTAASRRRRSSSLSVFGDSMRDSEARITVKLTDFGLAVAQEQCVDFDCGSKPYMAYECRNNVSQWYDPRQADIWSLGVVLLNLLFHRSPFSEPSVDGCESFAAYSYDPVHFLTQAFDGLTENVADYLAQNVLCDVTNPKSDGSPRRRITAKEFGAWAADLPHLLSVDGRPSRGADADVTSPMQHSRSPSSSGLASLLGSPSAQSSSGPPPLTIHEELGDDGQTSYPSLFPEYADRFEHDSPRRVPASRHFSSASLSPHPEGTPDILPSPTFSPPTRAHAELFPHTEAATTQPPPPEVQLLDGLQPEQDDDAPDTAKPPLSAKVETPRTARPAESASTQAAINWFEQQVASTTKTSSTPSAISWFEQQVAEATRAKPAVAVQTEVHAQVDADAGAEQVEELLGGEGEEDGHNMNGGGDENDGDDSSQYDATDASGSVAGSMNPKRRKRGARKGRSDKKQDLKRSHSAENLASLTDASSFPPMRRGEGREPISPHPRDAVLAELAAASQTLARQMSRAKPSGSSSGIPSVPSSPLWAPTHLSSGAPSIAGRRPSATPSLGLANVPSFMRDQEGMIDSPLGDTFGQDSVGSRASSTQFSNYSWAGRPPSIASTNTSGRLTDSSSGPSSSLASTVKPKWASTGAPRDSRLLREPRGPPLEDSGRSQPRSWRDRNTSTASIDSTSTFSSVFSDAPSSIYSTASAPAAAGRRSTASLASSAGGTGARPSATGSRSRFSKTGLLDIAGLDTISEKKRAQTKGDPLDASYLAAIFGAPPSKPVAKPSRRKEPVMQDHHAMPESRARPRQASASSDHSNSSQRTANGKPVASASLPSPAGSRKDAAASSHSLGQASELSLSTPPVPDAEPVVAAPPPPTPSKTTSNIAKFFSRRG